MRNLPRTLAALCAVGPIAALVITAPSVRADAGDPPAPAPATVDGVPHLSSPDNLPPDTTSTPPGPGSGGLAYLRELWHALQNQDISGKDAAILLFTQRPMDPNAPPPPGLSPGPQESDSQQLPN
ncbi:MAG TPA: dopamine receptor D4 [Mycobacterium sp.]|nr:dopamine receptor D4 [Mycobacterium sp.]